MNRQQLWQIVAYLWAALSPDQAKLSARQALIVIGVVGLGFSESAAKRPLLLLSLLFAPDLITTEEDFIHWKNALLQKWNLPRKWEETDGDRVGMKQVMKATTSPDGEIKANDVDTLCAPLSEGLQMYSRDQHTFVPYEAIYFMPTMFGVLYLRWSWTK